MLGQPHVHAALCAVDRKRCARVRPSHRRCGERERAERASRERCREPGAEGRLVPCAAHGGSLPPRDRRMRSVGTHHRPAPIFRRRTRILRSGHRHPQIRTTVPQGLATTERDGQPRTPGTRGDMSIASAEALGRRRDTSISSAAGVLLSCKSTPPKEGCAQLAVAVPASPSYPLRKMCEDAMKKIVIGVDPHKFEGHHIPAGEGDSGFRAPQEGSRYDARRLRRHAPRGCPVRASRARRGTQTGGSHPGGRAGALAEHVGARAASRYGVRPQESASMAKVLLSGSWNHAIRPPPARGVMPLASCSNSSYRTKPTPAAVSSSTT